MALTRGDAQQLDARDPLAPFRERFVIADEHRLYFDGNSLGRLPKAARERLHRQVDEWGERVVRGWPDWIDAPTRTGDVLAEVLGARPGQVLVTDSVHGQPLQARARAARCGPVAAGAGDRPRELPDRPLRPRGDRPCPRVGAGALRSRRSAVRAAAGRHPGRRTRRPVARRVSLGRPRRHGGHRPARDRDLGSQPFRRRGADRPGRARDPLRRRLHVQVPQRRPRRGGLPLRRRPGQAAIADPGLVRAGRPVRDGAAVCACAGHHAVHGGHAVDPRAGRDRGGRCGSRPRRGSRPCARSRSRRPSASSRCTTSGWRRWGSRSVRRATPRGVDRTSRSTIPRRGRSAAR